MQAHWATASNARTVQRFGLCSLWSCEYIYIYIHMYLCVCVENCRTNGNPALTSPFPRPVRDGHRVRLKPYSDRLMCMCVCAFACTLTVFLLRLENAYMRVGRSAG